MMGRFIDCGLASRTRRRSRSAFPPARRRRPRRRAGRPGRRGRRHRATRPFDRAASKVRQAGGCRLYRRRARNKKKRRSSPRRLRRICPPQLRPMPQPDPAEGPQAVARPRGRAHQSRAYARRRSPTSGSSCSGYIDPPGHRGRGRRLPQGSTISPLAMPLRRDDPSDPRAHRPPRMDGAARLSRSKIELRRLKVLFPGRPSRLAGWPDWLRHQVEVAPAAPYAGPRTRSRSHSPPEGQAFDRARASSPSPRR